MFIGFLPSGGCQEGTLEGTLLTELGGDLLSHYLDTFQLGDFWKELWCCELDSLQVGDV